MSNTNRCIEVINLTKMFGNKKVLNNISIKFQENKITGLIGFNGSGKTTTFNILAGFMEATEGKVLFNGKKPTLSTWNKLSYLAAGSEPKNKIRVLTHLNAIADMYSADKKWTKKKIETLSKKLEFTEFLKKPIKALSKGNQQKVKLISSFLNPNMKYLFLDEPFDGLDPLMVRKIVDLYLSLKKVTIIITSHRMEVVQEMTEEFYVLKDGDLVDFKKTSDPTIFIETNKEVSMKEIKKLKYVISVEKQNDAWVITAEDMKHFKTINKKIIDSPNYEYSSLKAKNIAESVFNKYIMKAGI